MSVITLDRICKAFGKHNVINDFSIDIEEGEFVCITGKSGSGKTTLLNIIGMIEKPDDGELTILGQKNPRFYSRRSRMLRAYDIGYLFQNYGLIENDTVKNNMKLSTRFLDVSYSIKESIIYEAIAKVGLQGYEERKVYSLSGGEQQRVAIAKIIAKNPKIILADEPTGSLDPNNRDYVLSLIKELNKRGKTIVVVTHDPVVEACSERKVRL